MLQRGGPVYCYHPYSPPLLRQPSSSQQLNESDTPSSPAPSFTSSWPSQASNENINPHAPADSTLSNPRLEPTLGLEGTSMSGPLATNNNIQNLPSFLLTPQGLDMHINKLKLGNRREEIHRFASMNLEQQNIVLFTMMLSNEASDDGTVLKQIDDRLRHIEQLSEGSWQPSPIQKQLLKGLIGHWLVQPLDTYEKFYELVGGYICVEAAWLKLGLYVNDPTVRITIDNEMRAIAGQMKSDFRKDIVNSITTKKKSLHDFCRFMLEKYHLPRIPREVPQHIKATLAMHRNLASERQAADTTEGKYWPALEQVLTKAYNDHPGEEQGTGSWDSWEKQQIAQDERKYGYPPAALPGPNQPIANFRPSASVPNPPEDDDDAHGDMLNTANVGGITTNICTTRLATHTIFTQEELSGDVTVSQLGDVAATIDGTRAVFPQPRVNVAGPSVLAGVEGRDVGDFASTTTAFQKA
ncbi:hypothetical protein DAEQUDRAFT_766013 [Daedalea quercina L-15889]|uniref:Uncharacterized protein n=1 Tax=Daedalea quercina L-15889 TaxID=1314783 RepID=A0A165PZH4_9APHY|nr:hypothetical protein DAEQUDRAFT_766013 [Daedalea quercina L-15889]